MLDDNTKIDIFFQFLKDNNAYDEYKKECRKSDMGCLFLDKKDENFVRSNFIWASTKNGLDFWFDINGKWLHEKEHYFIQHRRDKLLEKLCNEN